APDFWLVPDDRAGDGSEGAYQKVLNHLARDSANINYTPDGNTVETAIGERAKTVDLAATTGATLVGYDGESANVKLALDARVPTVATLGELQALGTGLAAGSAQRWYNGLLFTLKNDQDYSTLIAVDNVGYVIETTLSAAAAWVAEGYDKEVWVDKFGAKADGTAYTSEWQRALDTAAAIGHNTTKLPPGTWITGALTHAPSGFTLIGEGRPGNQDATDKCEIKAASTGITIFSSNAISVVSRPTVKGITFRGVNSSDITTRCFDWSDQTNVYGPVFEDVGFIDCNYGVIGKPGTNAAFAAEFIRVHHWNVATAAVVGFGGPSNIYSNCRTGLVPSSAARQMTNVTQANPAVASFDNANGIIREGDLIYFTGMAGMTEINDLVLMARNVTATGCEIQNLNSTSFGAFADGYIRRCATGFWLSGPSDLVLNADTAAKTSGIGSTQFMVGESPRRNYNGTATTLTAQANFQSAHLEGVRAAFVWVNSGSSASGMRSHFNTGPNPLPRAVYYEFLNTQCHWDESRFGTDPGGSYDQHFQVAAVDKATGELKIRPLFANESLIISGVTVKDALKIETDYVLSSQVASTQSIPTATYTKVLFSSDVIDSRNWSSSGTFTPQAPGIFRDYGYIRITDAAAGELYRIALYKNGALLTELRNVVSTTALQTFSYEFTYDSAAGDTWEIYLHQNSGANRTVSGGLNSSRAIQKIR
uniref:hypothetical protein n=1 Tax=Zhongshania sp. TaxID=1971902 RepID=UPI003566BFAA